MRAITTYWSQYGRIKGFEGLSSRAHVIFRLPFCHLSLLYVSLFLIMLVFLPSFHLWSTRYRFYDLCVLNEMTARLFVSGVRYIWKKHIASRKLFIDMKLRSTIFIHFSPSACKIPFWTNRSFDKLIFNLLYKVISVFAVASGKETNYRERLV